MTDKNTLSHSQGTSTVEPADGDLGVRRRWGWVHLCLLGTLGLLLAHAWMYAFLTDDAFISFRYARNFSEGYGLVFNPGFERVEGYTNFLWVVILAGFHAVGVVPESVSHVLTIGATIVLWGLMVWTVLRHPPEPGKGWLMVTAPLLLACTRSVAVWSTSGLETRIFEALIVGGVLRLIVEIEGQLKGQRPRAWSGLLFALGTLTRPDMLLVSGAAMGTAWLTLGRRRKLRLRWALTQASTYALLVGGHYAFRLAYYGEWFPNTYYAKVGGKTWWDMGAIYISMFILEYAGYLWIPMLVGAVRYHRQRGSLFVPGIFAAVIVPHALYIVSIGGDHFEYRPLDLYFPLVFLLIYDGAKYFARGRGLSLLTGAWLGLIVIGLIALPWQSHRQFPKRYVNAYPGSATQRDGADTYLSPENDPIYHLPGLRWIAQTHRDLLFAATTRVVGLRQEEHKLFLANVMTEGKRLGKLVENGRLPKDLYLSIGCVGAIPYYSNLRTLDQAGLTDAYVARHGWEKEERMMAHDKHAPYSYGLESGVTFWSLNSVSPLRHLTRRGFMDQIVEANRKGVPVYAANTGDGYYLVGLVPQGLERVVSTENPLDFRPTREPAMLKQMLREMVAAYEKLAGRHPEDVSIRVELAKGLVYLEDYAGAAQQYEIAVRMLPNQLEAWWNLGSCYERVGDLQRASESTKRALVLARSRDDAHLVKRVEKRLARYARKEKEIKRRSDTEKPTATEK